MLLTRVLGQKSFTTFTFFSLCSTSPYISLVTVALRVKTVKAEREREREGVLLDRERHIDCFPRFTMSNSLSLSLSLSHACKLCLKSLQLHHPPHIHWSLTVLILFKLLHSSFTSSSSTPC